MSRIKKSAVMITLITAILTVIMICASSTAFADVVDSGTFGADGDNLTWSLDDEDTLTIGGEGAMPANDFNFIMNKPWKNYITQIKKVVIGEGVTTLDGQTFRDCTALAEVELSDSIVTIGTSSFQGCTSLKTIDLPDSVEAIYNNAFSGCTLLETIDLPDSVEAISNNAFQNCTSLTSIDLPDSIESINAGVFQGCTALETIGLPDALKSVGSWAFSGCTLLAEIDLPDTVETVGMYAFQNCTSLKSITVPDGGSSMFAGCTSLEEVVFKDGATKIGWNCFNGCSSLKKLTIPATITDFNGAFTGVDSFPEITGGYCSEDGVIYSLDKTILVFASNEIEAEFQIPENVKKIAENAFLGNLSLEKIEIPEGVELSEGAFEECAYLTTAVLPDNLEEIPANLFFASEELSEVNIPQSVKVIGRGAFSTTGITSAVIPEGVTELNNTFADCYNLEEVSLPSTLEIIGDYTFDGCASLSELDIPASVKEIGKWAFATAGIRHIVIPDGVTEIQDYTFDLSMFAQYLESIVIPKSVTSIGRYAFGQRVNTGLKKVYYRGTKEEWDAIEAVSWNAMGVLPAGQSKPDKEIDPDFYPNATVYFEYSYDLDKAVFYEADEALAAAEEEYNDAKTAADTSKEAAEAAAATPGQEAVDAAKKAAEDAKTVADKAKAYKAAADAAVKAAEKAAVSAATDDEKAEASQALEAARAKAETASDAKNEAQDAYNDARFLELSAKSEKASADQAAAIEQINTLIDSLSTEIEGLDGRLQELEKDPVTKAELEEELAALDLENKINGLKTQIAALEKLAEDLVTKEELNGAIDEKITAINGQITSLNNQITTLDGQLTTLKDEINNKESAEQGDNEKKNTAIATINKYVEDNLPNIEKADKMEVEIAALKGILAVKDAKAQADIDKAVDDVKTVVDEKVGIKAAKDAAKALKVAGLKARSKKQKFTVSWKKTEGAEKYQVQYQLKGKKWTNLIKSTAKVKATSKKLKKGKKYIFRVRTCNTVNGVKVYGKWAKTKAIKCK